MPPDESVALVRLIFEQVVNHHDFTALDTYFAADYVAHSALLGDVRGVASFERGFRTFLDPCPDFHAALEDVFASGDKVAARVIYRGTDTGGMFGREPTGKTFTMSALYIFRLEGGRITELWQEADRLGLLQQLGAVPAPGPANR